MDSRTRFNRRHLLAGTAGLAGLTATRGALASSGAPALLRYGRSQAAVSGEIEFAYYNWGPDSIQYFKDMASAFEAAHPGTKINLTLPPYDQYDTKLKVLLA